MYNLNFNTNQPNYTVPIIAIGLGIVLAHKLYQKAISFFSDQAAKEKLLKEAIETNNKLHEENKELKSKIIEIKTIAHTNKLLFKERRKLLFADTTRTKYVYNRSNLQKIYASNNKDNPYRVKPLKIVKIENNSNPKLIMCINHWIQTIQDMERLTAPMSPQTHSKLAGARFLICNTDFLKTSNDIAAAIDDNDEIQAICFYQNDPIFISACKIEFLISSPLNVKESSKKKVEGAGTALIQYAIEQALLRQSLNYYSPIEIVDGEVAVTLNSIEEATHFYKHIGFETLVRNSMILQGKNLVEFLKKYGGRYE